MDKKELKEIVEEIIGNECYDMAEEFSSEEIVKMVLKLVPMQLRVMQVQLNQWRYIIKVKNDRESFVSVSSIDTTGVSRSTYYIFEDSMNPTEDEIKTLLDMINEAWYLCKE